MELSGIASYKKVIGGLMELLQTGDGLKTKKKKAKDADVEQSTSATES